MPAPFRVATLLLTGLSMGADPADGPKQPLDAANVARRPAPGSVVPGGIEFAGDGRSVYYLKSESNSLDRVLWKADVRNEKPPRVVARPPGAGTTEANVSGEEALRRERLRLVDTGITSFVRNDKADLTVFPLNSDLYLQRGEGPLDRLTDNSAPEVDPKLSPDGTRLAFVRDRELFVLDLATRKETQLTRGAADGLSHGLAEFMAEEEMDRHTGYWWSPDGASLAYQETDERHIPPYTIVHDGAEKPSAETHRYPFTGAANARVRLGIIPSAGGETRWIEFEEPGREFYLARVDWETPTTLLVQRLIRDQTALSLYRVNTRTGSSTQLLEESSDTWVNLHHDLRPVPATGEFVWSSERSGFRRLELRDRQGDLVRELTPAGIPVDSVVALDEKRREVWYQAPADPLGMRLFRASIDGGEPLPLVPEPGTHKAVVAEDGDAFVLTTSTVLRPPVTTLRHRDGRVIATLDDAGNDPRLASLDLEPPKFHRFTSRDGVDLHGAYYAPRSGALGPKAPLVVLLYGGPHVQYVADSWALTADLRAQYLAQKGFAVWKMDNRGSARRGHAFEAALHKNMGSVEVRDQVDGVRYIASKEPGVDPTRVGVNGRSYGGYMTLRCLTEAPDVFQAGVAEAPVTDWDGYDTCYTERYMDTPARNAQGYKDASVLTRVGRLQGKLLVMHGLIDENVHFRHTARLVAALVAAGKPFEVLPMPEERHSSRKPASRTLEVERLTSFFEKSLAPAGR